MAQAINHSQETKKGRGKGLLIEWSRELEKKLQINRYLLGRSIRATLAIMDQMDQCPGRRPGVEKETHCDLDHMDSKSIRTQYQQTGPRDEEAPKDGQSHGLSV